MNRPQRGEVFTVALNPTVGREISKARPCVIVSPDSMNRVLDTVIIAPLTSTIRPWPTRVAVTFEGKRGSIVLDQLRTVDLSRLRKRRGQLDVRPALVVLQAMFAP